MKLEVRSFHTSPFPPQTSFVALVSARTKWLLSQLGASVSASAVARWHHRLRETPVTFTSRSPDIANLRLLM